MLSLTSGSATEIFLSVLTFLIIIGLVIAIHEAAHAFAANRLGDPTARLLGRMTINPLSHVDPIGTILIPLVLLLLNFPVFGWAKPTPVNPLNLKKPRRDSAIVAFAGPSSNFAMAIVFALLFRILPGAGFVSDFLLTLITINLLLGIFNLLPIPPLDGYKVLLGILPKEAALRLSFLENVGPVFLILFIFLFFGFFSSLMLILLRALLLLLTGASSF